MANQITYNKLWDKVREWEQQFAEENLQPRETFEDLVLWLAKRELQKDIPYSGRTLKEQLSNKSSCCCDTFLICNTHDKYIGEQP